MIAQLCMDFELYHKVVPHPSHLKWGYETVLTAYRCDSATAPPPSLISCGYVDTAALSVNSVSTPPCCMHQANFSPLLLFCFSLSPPMAAEIQKNTNRLCLCITESKQVKKQQCYSPESMLVSSRTPLPEVYSGGSLRSLHYPRASPGIQPGSCGKEHLSWKEA